MSRRTAPPSGHQIKIQSWLLVPLWGAATEPGPWFPNERQRAKGACVQRGVKWAGFETTGAGRRGVDDRRGGAGSRGRSRPGRWGSPPGLADPEPAPFGFCRTEDCPLFGAALVAGCCHGHLGRCPAPSSSRSAPRCACGRAARGSASRWSRSLSWTGPPGRPGSGCHWATAAGRRSSGSAGPGTWRRAVRQPICCPSG